MLHLYTPHSEKYEIPSAAMAVLATDPRRLDQ
jgi:hypothetical protein